MTATILVGVVAAGCASDSAGVILVTRDTLANGAARLRYGSLPAPSDSALAPDLRIGKVEGEAHEIFGDVRGIEADPAGNIYVLDYQTAEVRAYDANGQYLRTLTRKGGGPAEITESNGMVFGADGTLWLQDHAKWQMIGITTDGVEVARHPMPVLSYGYIYNGGVDDRGRFWKVASHSDEERVYPPPEGVMERRARSYAKWLDPATGTTDSIFLRERISRSYVLQNARGGYSYYAIPFASGGALVFDRAGGFWDLDREDYRIVRLDESGDTALVVEVQVAGLPVTDEDRAEYVAGFVERDASLQHTAEALVAQAPDTRPVLDQLFVDDEGNVWVRRVAAGGDNPRFDVFARDGVYVGSVKLGFTPSPWLAPRIRDGNLYALVVDSLDVPTVVRAPLRALTR